MKATAKRNNAVAARKGTRKLDRVAIDGPDVVPDDRPVTVRGVAAIKAIVAAMDEHEGCSKAYAFRQLCENVVAARGRGHCSGSR